MLDEVKTIITKNHISMLILAGNDYTGCILPRKDAHTLSLAIRKSAELDSAVNFKTEFMNVDVMDLKGILLIDCVAPASGQSFQLGCVDAENMANVLKESVTKANNEFGPTPENADSKWLISFALSEE